MSSHFEQVFHWDLSSQLPCVKGNTGALIQLPVTHCVVVAMILEIPAGAKSARAWRMGQALLDRLTTLVARVKEG